MINFIHSMDDKNQVCLLINMTIFEYMSTDISVDAYMHFL